VLRSALIILAAIVVSRGLVAQIIRGQVVDSLSGLPLPGGSIALLSEAGDKLRQTVADSNGLFLIRAAAAEGYRLRVRHPAYATSVFPPFSLDHDQVRGFMLLVTPAEKRAPAPVGLVPQDVLARVCPAGVAPGFPTIVGLVRDAASGESVAGAEVHVSMPSIPRHLRQYIEIDDVQRNIVSEEDGVYALCGVPVLERIGLYATAADKASDYTRLVFVEGGVMVGARYHEMETLIWYHDLRLASPDRRTATVSGTVTDSGGAGIANADVRLLATDISTQADEHGRFELRGLPAGWVRLEAMRVGYRPVEYDLELVQGVSRTVPEPMLVLQPIPVELAEIFVSGEAAGVRRRLAGFYDRRDKGIGSYVTFDEYVERWGQPIRPSDMIRTMRGIRVGPDGRVTARRCTRGGLPVVYLDGMYLGNTGFTDVDVILAPHHIEGIEVYTDATIPPQFNRLGAVCGAIVIWTR